MMTMVMFGVMMNDAIFGYHRNKGGKGHKWNECLGSEWKRIWFLSKKDLDHPRN